MPTTLQIQSFSESNIRERTGLSQGASQGIDQVLVQSTQGIEAGASIYVGVLSRERCELVTVQAVLGPTILKLTTPLQFSHLPFEPVTSVLGPRIRVYRALNVDGSVPPDSQFNVLATRSIDSDQETTYYTDNSGSSSYWYRFTNFNETSSEETPLGGSDPVRGDDFGHYASLSAIRREAGFEGAVNLSDVVIDQQRRIAETELNLSLTGVYEVPFKTKVPPIIRSITERLAAGFLLNVAYPDTKPGDAKIKDARAQLDGVKTQSDTLAPEDGAVDLSGDAITYNPNNDRPDRDAFSMSMRF